MSLSIHALDTREGVPAEGMRYTLRDADGAVIHEGVTNSDGRGEALSELAAGVYRMTFDSGAYHAARGVECFHPEVVVCFEVTDPSSHHHIPLILSPFGYSTYRGS